MFEKELMKWRRKRPSWISWIALMGLCALLSYHLSALQQKKQNALLTLQIRDFKQQIDGMKSEKEKLTQELMNSSRHYQMALEAQKNLGNYLNSLQKQNTELTQDVTLYQTVSGKSWNQTVQIKTFQIFLSNEPNTFRYSLMLSRKAAGQGILQGTVLMTILGKMGETVIEIPVKYINAHGLTFKFTHFQELSGELALPQGFEPQEVFFKLSQPGWPDLRQSFPWVKVGQ